MGPNCRRPRGKIVSVRSEPQRLKAAEILGFLHVLSLREPIKSAPINPLHDLGRQAQGLARNCQNERLAIVLPSSPFGLHPCRALSARPPERIQRDGQRASRPRSSVAQTVQKSEVTDHGQRTFLLLPDTCPSPNLRRKWAADTLSPWKLPADLLLYKDRGYTRGTR